MIKCSSTFPTNSSNILEVFFENNTFMFSHFRWRLLCNKMNSYTPDGFITFSSITKTVLILVAFCCQGHEPCHLKIRFQYDPKDRIAPDLFCAYKTCFSIFYNNNSDKSDVLTTNRTVNNYQISATWSCPGQQNAIKISTVLATKERLINASVVLKLILLHYNHRLKCENMNLSFQKENI